MSTPRAGTTTSASATSPTQHNDADTQFAQMMIVHHQGAIEMGKLATSKGSTPDVRALGQRIVAAQGPEIELMSGWLAQWGAPMPAVSDHSAMPGMEVGGMSQSSATDQLAGSSGTAFDRQFLTLMISHHEGALQMAASEQAQGQNADARKLAAVITTSQTAEIEQMRAMLATLGTA
ncbi:DUF305 domain-containing protein [Cellulomonas sp. SG140]|uniref:DUF305 domain-containing protein n=1 Tax=Cellulomonas sp. SG140 TaxID=2976536 RepID=UPI0021E84A38|nr:DUF305 domain-containing protein [Cellulomonas sp. SG140]